MRLVLVEPRVSGNVGACARAAMNFGVSELALVRPQCDWQDEDSRRRAVSEASAVLERARVFGSLADATRDCVVSAGFTRRLGRERQPASLALLAPELAVTSSVALVFGNEETGLSQADLAVCTHTIQIDTAPDLPSLNLSHAVAIALARIHEARTTPLPAQPSPLAATVGELEALFDHWQQVLRELGVGTRKDPARTLLRIRGLVRRARPSSAETAWMRAILSKTQRRLGIPGTRGGA